MAKEALKLKATDDEDLEVFATVLQDAPMPLREIVFLDEERRFAALLHRYCYEQARERPSGGALEQVACALVFEEVTNAEVWDIADLGSEGAVELMTIVSEDVPGAGIAITLVFHGGGHIKLEADRIRGRLADLGEHVTAKRQPRHTPLFDA